MTGSRTTIVPKNKKAATVRARDQIKNSTTQKQPVSNQ